MNNALRILLTLLALAALGLSLFLMTREQAGVTLKPVAVTLKYAGFAVGFGLCLLLAVTKTRPATGG